MSVASTTNFRSTDTSARDDDDDDFLWGTSQPNPTPVSVTPSTSLASLQVSEGSVAQLEAQARALVAEASTSQATDVSAEDESEEAVDMGGETEDEEDDVEIIMEAQSRSLDFRQQSASVRPPLRNSASSTALRGQPSLTTEYTPIQRAGASVPPQAGTPLRVTPQAQTALPATPQQAPGGAELEAAPQVALSALEGTPEGVPAPTDDDVDPLTLPPVPAPPSHPAIDPNATGMMEGRPIIDVDLSSMTDKQWRRPGSDVSDWFNYGFDELSWEAYCYRRRDLGELANVLKTNVLNFSGMPEEQLTVLPPEVRQMVMTGTTAMMNGAANPAMMGQGMMMDMSGMMGPMGMGMNGDMGMNGPMMQVDGRGMMGMQDGSQVGNGTPEQHGAMQDGFGGNQSMMGMGMEYAGQNQMVQQQMYPQMEAPQPTPPSGPVGRGAAAVPYRARGLRGARGFPGRGRGRGGYDAPPAPVRPTSPLPPNVPTGPRNQNKYKDRDNNTPAVDGLDYGGTKDGRTTSGEPEERSRKRRSSPGLEEGRGSKRR
ncbi:hypothetical protein B0H15DRAFT_196969 [Mycena belliarum]|uniref:Pre-mRNA polyadenylation factor Fip1 domain-containing protein n=1 Tax=Mycena belliarum TaxID=1033014 RepID=A0AAD6UNX7_9AGAR|nr:hypothetical protein B0H15DRAFT_196969 [Mycena belliae]